MLPEMTEIKTSLWMVLQNWLLQEALTGKSSFSHKGEKAGLEVIKAGKDATGKDVSKDDFTAAVKNISYENSSKYEYSTASDGLSVSLKEVKKDPDPDDEQQELYAVI